LTGDEKNEIARAGIELFFGRKWRDGKIKLRETSIEVKELVGLGPGNEYTVILSLSPFSNH
jgi:hypothetical protein